MDTLLITDNITVEFANGMPICVLWHPDYWSYWQEEDLGIPFEYMRTSVQSKLNNCGFPVNVDYPELDENGYYLEALCFPTQ